MPGRVRHHLFSLIRVGEQLLKAFRKCIFLDVLDKCRFREGAFSKSLFIGIKSTASGIVNLRL